MSEPTREQKLKTIRLANRIIYNKLREMTPDIQEFSANADYLAGLFKSPIPQTHFVEDELRKLQPQPITPVLPETPEERARFQALLAELKEKK